MSENYFETLELPITFFLDEKLIEESYTRLFAKHHPDNFDSPEDMLAASQKSVSINTAYEVIKYPISRAKYLLQLQGIDIESQNRIIQPDAKFFQYLIDAAETLRNIQEHDTKISDIKAKQSKLQEALEECLASHSWIDAAKVLLKIVYLQGVIKHSKD